MQTAAGSSEPSPSASGDALLQSLLESGRLTVDQKLAIPIDDGRTVAVVLVELSHGVAEPRHTHPDPESRHGLERARLVELDRAERVAITPDAAVRVERGQIKALHNGSAREPFSVLAVLILEQYRPPLTTVD